MKQATEFYASYSALGGRIVEDKDGIGNVKTKTVPYKFGAGGVGGGNVRWDIIKNRRILKPYDDAFVEARDQAILHLTDGVGIIDENDRDKIIQLNKEIQVILGKKVEIKGLVPIRYQDLNLGENVDLPDSIVTALGDLITE